MLKLIDSIFNLQLILPTGWTSNLLIQMFKLN